MAQQGWAGGWSSAAECPIWICTGGPHDGRALPTSMRAGVYRDEECVKANGVYCLKNKREGRYTVPTAVWTPLKPESAVQEDINRVEATGPGER